MPKIQGKLRTNLWILFIIYCVVMLWLLFVRTPFDIKVSYWTRIKMNIRPMPFHTISHYMHLLNDKTNQLIWFDAIINLFGNIANFIPLGIFLPYFWEKLQSLKWFLLCFSSIIIIIEVTQLFTLRGICDIDDLILNVFGGVIGYLAYRLSLLFSNILCSSGEI